MDAGGDEAGALGGSILGMAVLVIVAVSFSQLRLIITERAYTFARWKLSGMPGWLVFVLLGVLIMAVCLLGPFLGAQQAHWFVEPALEQLRADGIPLGNPSEDFPAEAIATWVCAGAGIVGGWLPLWRVSRREPARVPPFPETEAGPWAKAWRVGRTVIAYGLLAALIYPAVARKITEPDEVMSWGMGLIMAFVVFGGWLVPPLIQLTRAGRLAGPLAQVAAANLRARVRFAAPQIVPWVLVGTLFFGVGSALRIGGAEQGASYSSPGVFVVVLAPVLGPALVAACVTPLLLRRRARRDSRGLFLSGASRRQQLLLQMWEATFLTVVAASAFVALGIAIVAPLHAALGHGFFPPGWWSQLWWSPVLIVVAAMFLVTTAMKIAVSRASNPGCAAGSVPCR
ncbi:hypothetical protein ACEE23_04140 [Corynebacterium sp. 32222D000AT]|nr:hypothetical protein [Mycobacteriaceae bacterium]MDY5829192.1 hypothetical protein [Corynebacterium sp.]